MREPKSGFNLISFLTCWFMFHRRLRFFEQSKIPELSPYIFDNDNEERESIFRSLMNRASINPLL